MTTLQKTLVAAVLAGAIGVAIYETRQAARLRAQVETLQQPPVAQPEPSQNPAVATLQDKVEALEAQTNALAAALALANTDKARLEMEREQARRSAALYKDLVEQASARQANPTNAYPTARHVWVAFGKMGRLTALSKEDDTKLSAEEKSALELAQSKALEELPNLLKAAKQQLDSTKSSEGNLESEEMMDGIACLLYGALNLDEQQFGQVYGVMQKLQQEAKLKGLSKETPAPEKAEAIKQVMEQWKTETQALLTPEQTRIFAEVVTHFQVEPGKFGFNFSF